MGDNTAIQWTDATWNPVTGCTKVSPGCAYCYIARTPPFRMAGRGFDHGKTHGGLLFHSDRLDQPLRWKRPRRIFVNSLSDLFHEDIPSDFIAQVFEAMFAAPQHVYQVLTKRPERMRELLRLNLPELATSAPNIWIGVTVENQHFADERIPILLDTPAAVRFVSAEPLLGPLNLARGRNNTWSLLEGIDFERLDDWGTMNLPGLDWVIAGGESGGPPNRALVERWQEGFGAEAGSEWVPKAAALGWMQSLRDQCAGAFVPFFFKQWGGRSAKSGGRELDGREWSEFPDGR